MMTFAEMQAVPRWRRIIEVLEKFRRNILGRAPTLLCNVYAYSNDAFVLRAGVSILRTPDDDEIVVTLDAFSEGANVLVTYDLCTEGGRVVAEGSTRRISKKQLSSNEIDKIANDFEAFLEKYESDVIGLIILEKY